MATVHYWNRVMPTNDLNFEINGYTKVKILGTGARSEIWLIKQNGTERLFALKRTTIRNRSDLKYVEQSRNEYETLQHVSHPNIRKVYAIREARGFFHVREVQLIMEYCRGVSLKERPPCGIERITNIFTQTAAIMHQVNSAG